MQSTAAAGLTSRMRVVRGTTGVTCFVLGEDESPDESQVAPWRQAATEASRILGTRHKQYPWVAIVGPDPYGRGFHEPQRLMDEATLGPITLTPRGVLMHEILPVPPEAINVASRPRPYNSWPLIAQGSVSAYDIITAMTQARRPLHRLCALLSVAWGTCWVRRSEPTLSVPGQGRPAIPGDTRACGEHDRRRRPAGDPPGLA